MDNDLRTRLMTAVDVVVRFLKTSKGTGILLGFITAVLTIFGYQTLTNGDDPGTVIPEPETTHIVTGTTDGWEILVDEIKKPWLAYLEAKEVYCLTKINGDTETLEQAALKVDETIEEYKKVEHISEISPVVPEDYTGIDCGET